MEGTFGRYLSSPLFTFQIGPDKKEVTVHSSAVAGLSPSLDALLNGGMIEAKLRLVDWSDVDVDTFARLCEFAYLRDYTPPSYRLVDGYSPVPQASTPIQGKKKRMKRNSRVPSGHVSVFEAAMQPEPEPAIECADEPEPVPEEPPAPEPEPTSAVHSDPELPYKERSVWTRHLRDAFMGGSFIPGPQTKDLNLAFTPPHNTGSWEDFTPVFVEQARLYVLADKYGIEPLCQLVLSKLHQTLKDFKLYPTGVAGVLEFVRFVYSNTPPNYANRVDAMRSLATRYVVSVLGQIGETEEFQELLEEGGAFVTDFWHIIWSANATLRQ